MEVVGTNIAKFFKKKKYKVFIPKKGKYKFNKNLHNIIYCIGNDNWATDPKECYDANLGIVPKILFNLCIAESTNSKGIIVSSVSSANSPNTLTLYAELSSP